MIEDVQKDIDFCHRAVKINGMAISWDVLDVSDRDILLEVIKHRKRFRFPKCVWRNEEEIASRVIQLYPKNEKYSNSLKYFNLGNRMLKEN